ncbi:MAG: tRNA (adenosine(37)-N6)-threonylcarbamoyltransferase complex ATPase subunit type 1 TsaE [Candidatus Saccharimonadales bacterium]
MNKFIVKQIDSASAGQTEKIAEQIGRKLKGGEVMELVSDLGGGKTTFVRGLAHGLGSTAQVSSPTFKISNEYRCPNFRLYHFDFYRLVEPGLISNELAEIIGDPEAIIIIEWGEIMQNVLQRERLTINFKTTGKSSRQLELSCPSELDYLLPEQA